MIFPPGALDQSPRKLSLARWLSCALGAAALLAVLPAKAEERVVPGAAPDGYTRLHNLELIKPAGRQIPLGDLPVNIAVDPSGRFAAVLHAGAGPHEIRIVDIQAARTICTTGVHETFGGIAFSPDGKSVLCSGGSDECLHVFSFKDGALGAHSRIVVGDVKDRGVVSGVAVSRRGHLAAVGRLFENEVVCVDLDKARVLWRARLGPPTRTAFEVAPTSVSPNDAARAPGLAEGDEPYHLIWDDARGRIYASLWGRSEVAVLDARDGRELGRWACGLHPNELVLSEDGRLFVSNGGLSTVSVLSTDDGRCLETLSSALDPKDLPGATPDSLALSADGRRLFVANAYASDVAVFDISKTGSSRPLGFIPAGWFPSCVRETPDMRHLLVLNARGLEPRANGAHDPEHYPDIKTLYPGTLGIVDLPRGERFDQALAAWTSVVRGARLRPEPAPVAGNPIPAEAGGRSPIRYVIYVIKENRTYDQVLGDLPQGNGDPDLCLFPEKVTPNQHALAREFVLLDNFYANAEVSTSGHEWSMGAYSSEFVEKIWPTSYGHRRSKLPYPAEGNFAAAVPGTGYLWDNAARACVSYRSYGEFVVLAHTPAPPFVSNLPVLKDHVDPLYHPWDTKYHDIDRAARFISELHRFEAQGEMPRLQVLRFPQDHTAGEWPGNWTPTAMVADNDLALGRLVEAVSHSKFWAETAIFVVEDDAQNGPDHVDAHRTVALVISPYTRRGVVDSTAYTTCSMLRTMELILGLPPMTQFDSEARPMWASFQAKADLRPYVARPARVDIEARNPADTKAARLSLKLDFSREDAVDDILLNRIVWASVRGESSAMPAPRHAAFVRTIASQDEDDD